MQLEMTLVWVGGENETYLDIGLLQVMGPRGEQVLAHLLIEVPGVSNESGR